MRFVQVRQPVCLFKSLAKLCLRSTSNQFQSSSSKEYNARKLVGYSASQMYNVVSDVQHYQDFVPFCTKSVLLKADQNNLWATLEIGFPPIVESYTSHVMLVEHKYVSAQCRDGALFNYLETTWHFSPGLKSNELSCILDFCIRFEFRSMAYSRIASMFFEKLVQQMEMAFIREAQRRYGAESVPCHNLSPPWKPS